MVYKYEEKIVNRNNIDNFYNKNSFVGYILPNGEIYQCKEHNISNIDTVLRMDLDLLIKNYNDKDKILDNDSNDILMKIIVSYLNKLSQEQIVALNNFINKNNLFVSDLIVQLFGCHLVTRLNKLIITSEIDHSLFFDYLLNDFKINTIDKMIYDKDNKEYKFIHGIDRNEYLYDEIDKIKKGINNDEVELFYRGK